MTKTIYDACKERDGADAGRFSNGTHAVHIRITERTSAETMDLCRPCRLKILEEIIKDERSRA